MHWPGVAPALAPVAHERYVPVHVEDAVSDKIHVKVVATNFEAIFSHLAHLARAGAPHIPNEHPNSHALHEGSKIHAALTMVCHLKDEMSCQLETAKAPELQEEPASEWMGQSR
jgi:hypothetical protein